MNMWTLQLIIKHFDYAVKHVDFQNLPEKDSLEYRLLLLKTANDEVFFKGRYNTITEYTLEIFDIPEVCKLVCDLRLWNTLSTMEHTRLSFYMDLKELCYPLFRGKEVNWNAWPWQMKSGSSSLDNTELFNFITSGQYPCLAAAILFDLQQLSWMDEDFYSSVAKQEMSDLFEHDIKSKWSLNNKTEENENSLSAAVNQVANQYWFIENHMHVGHLLGFDLLAQSVYDAFDTFIDHTYRHCQVKFALELAAWIHENWTMKERHPAPEKLQALEKKAHELMAIYGIESPNMGYTWNILLLDVLGMAMFSEEEENEKDEEWNLTIWNKERKKDRYDDCNDNEIWNED